MFNFTQKKFLSQPLIRQHKKCSELLRSIYAKYGNEEWSANWKDYLQLLKWMEEPLPKKPTSFKTIADIYHSHLKKGAISKKEHHLLPQVRQGDRSEGEKIFPISIYLDGIRSAHNVGSIIRTTEAFSLGQLYFSPATPPDTHKQVKDAAMGTEKWVSCHPHADLTTLPRPLIAIETSNEAISLYDFLFPESFTLVIGNEEVGCSDEALSLSDYLIEIPMRGRKNSLNVANAFAIVASEICRQKNLRST